MTAAGWGLLGLAAWFVVAFPLGVAVGRHLRDRSPHHLEPRPGTPEPDRTIREPPWTSPT